MAPPFPTCVSSLQPNHQTRLYVLILLSFVTRDFVMTENNVFQSRREQYTGPCHGSDALTVKLEFRNVANGTLHVVYI